MKIKQLAIDTPQGRAGSLVRESRYVFTYSTTEPACQIAIAMPLRAQGYAGGAPMPIFEMNRPEGYLESKIIERFGKVGGIDTMGMLALIGPNQIGRLTYVTDQPIVRREQTISLAELLRSRETEELFDFLVETYFDSGVSGVQPKVLVPRTEELAERATVLHRELIVKAGSVEYPNLPINEYLCMSAARRAGMDVPEFWLADAGNLFVMRRFDVENAARLGFEDMAVLLGRRPDEKYQSSYEMIAKAIQLFSAEADPSRDLMAFFRIVALSVMVRNGDAHLKNFGMLYVHPQDLASRRLAPAFDIVTTSVYGLINSQGITRHDRTLALKLAKSRLYPSRNTLLNFARDICLIKHPERILDELASAMADTLRAERDRVPVDFLAAMTEEWDAGRLGMESTRVFART